MSKTIYFWLLVVLTLVGCGPRTIFVRPGLDTAAQHVSNGYQLIEMHKWNDACREFQRAKDLDPNYTDAFVGLAIAYGGKGDFENGFKILDAARRIAVGQEELDKIRKADERLHAMSKVP